METGKRLLIVDDEPYVCRLLSRWLSAEGYECETAENGNQALERIEASKFEVLVTDISMPELTGMELLASVKKRYGDEVAVIMVTGVDDRETAIQALQLGAYGYIIKPFDENEVLIQVVNALERRRLVMLSRDHERRLEEEVRERTAEVREREEEVVLRLMSASEYRDDETGAHIRRIGLFSGAVAQAAGWDEESVSKIRLAAPMHDVGKIGVPDNILLKPARLTSEEFEVVKQHTVIGNRILGDSSIPLLQLAADIALSHHEKVNGRGYPHGLEGDNIPECARIVAIVDVYDALVSHRVYKPALPEDEALAILEEGRGQHFDSRLLDCFLEVRPELRHIRGIIDRVQNSLPELEREVELYLSSRRK